MFCDTGAKQCPRVRCRSGLRARIQFFGPPALAMRKVRKQRPLASDQGDPGTRRHLAGSGHHEHESIAATDMSRPSAIRRASANLPRPAGDGWSTALNDQTPAPDAARRVRTQKTRRRRRAPLHGAAYATSCLVFRGRSHARRRRATRSAAHPGDAGPLAARPGG